MEDMDSDWDSEEFQAALKTVLKYEIQSLLERLSKTGEETVLLTVNTVDMCVSHLASSNAQKFVNSADVGQVKMKFLQFVSGRPSSVLSYQKPLVKADQDCGAYSDSEINNQAKWAGPTTTVKPATKRGQEFSQQDLQGTQNKRQKLDPAQNQPTTPQAQKNASMVKPAGATAVLGKISETAGKNPVYSDGDNTREKSLDQAMNKANIKLNTTKFVSKSGGFTEERLSEKEFNNLLKMCNSDIEEEEEEDYEGDEYIEAEGVHLPSQLSFLLQGKHSTQIRQQLSPKLQQQPRPSAPLTATPVRPTGLIVPPKTLSTSSLVTNRLNPEIKPKGPLQGKPDTKSELEKDIASQVNRFKLSGDVSREDGGSVRKQTPSNTVVRDSDSNKIIINPLINTGEIKEEIDPNDEEYRQSDPNKSRTGGASDKQSVQEKENRADGIGVQKDVKLNTQKQANQAQQRSQLEDELDTETLIKMAKAKHKENESDADKAIQAKLGQLSSKLSWVVEYPKDEKDSWKAQPQQQRLMLNQGLGKVFAGQPEMEDEEEEEEDYDEEDFEDELDEEELAALKAYHEKQISEGKLPGFPGVGGVTGQFRDMHGEEYHGEYGDEEEEEEYGEGYDYEEEGIEDGGMGHYMGSQPQGVGNQVSGEASPHFENFLLIGPIMAKCLICNKLIRKTEMKSHNQIHIEEAEEEMDEAYEEMDEEEENWEEEVEGEEGIGEEDQGEGEEFIHQREVFDQQSSVFSSQGVGQDHRSNRFLQQGDEFEQKGEEFDQQRQVLGHPEGDGEEFNQEHFSQEEKDNELNEHYEEETEESAEYTAEKFVAEKVEFNTDGGGKKKKSTTCDICNKDFKSHANMSRHRKIHTDSGTHSCHLCPKSFKQASYLAAHVKKKHRNQKEEATKTAEEGTSDKTLESDISTEEKSLKEHTET